MVINFWTKIILELNDTFDFKEPLEIVDLSEGHCDEEKRLKHRPPDNPRIGVIIDCTWREKKTII